MPLLQHHLHTGTTMKILIIGPAWVGDMIMAQSLFRFLKSKHPDSQIDVLAPDWTRALLSRMPEISNAISMPVGHGKFALGIRLEIGKKLRSEKYDQAITLPNSFKSALIPWIAQIPKRTGWMRECRYILLNDWRRLDKEKYKLMIERFLALGIEKDNALVKPYPYPKLIIDKASLQNALQKFALNTDKPIVALCAGAEFGPSKRWPADYFAQVAQQKLTEGYQIFLFGSANDLPICKYINEKCGMACVDLCGKTSLAEAIDLLSTAEIVVANDSGLMHIAAALDKPVVAVYGSTSPDFTPPLSNKVEILKLDLECQPCFKRECPLGHWNCMKLLTSDKVLSAIDNLKSSDTMPRLTDTGVNSDKTN